MRVWVTRTEPGASRLARRLADAGYSVLNAPVLRIADTGVAAPAGCFDFVLFVSAHAVERAFARGLELRPGVAAGIGAGAENALRRRGIEPRLTGLTNAAAVPSALGTPPARTLVVKGHGGRDVVQNWLRGQDAAVAEWNVYRRVPTTPALDGERIDVIVAASGDGVVEIGKHWFADGRSGGVPLLVPSPRVAELAAAAGFDHAVVADGAGDDAVMAALKELRGSQVG